MVTLHRGFGIPGLGLGLWHEDPALAAGGAVAPANTVAPEVTGVGYVGNTLTTTDGTWTGSPAPTFTYQWQCDGVDVPGSTAATYLVTLNCEGKPVRCVVTATNSEGSASANSNAIEQWVPTDAGTVDGWWDAYSPLTITIATGVSQWSNRGSRAGGDLVSGNAAEQPTYSATGWDGVRPAITWDGSDDRIRVLSSAGTFTRDAAGLTVIGVAKPADTGIQRALFNVSTTGASSTRFSIRSQIANFYVVAGRRLNADAYAEFDPTPYTMATRLFAGQADHANNQARVSLDGTLNGWVTPAQGAGNTDATQGQSLAVGSSDTTRLFSGPIAEVIFYQYTLPDADMNKLNGYLAWRWGVTASLPSLHPFKTAPPTP